MRKTYTHHQLLRELEERAAKLGSQKKLAEQLGVEQPTLSKVLRGIDPPHPVILRNMGLEKRITYVAVDREPVFL